MYMYILVYAYMHVYMHVIIIMDAYFTPQLPSLAKSHFVCLSILLFFTCMYASRECSSVTAQCAVSSERSLFAHALCTRIQYAGPLTVNVLKL